MTTPADWYPDPEDPAGLRYWDGTTWTEHRAPAPSAAPAEAPAPEPTPTPAPDDVPASEQATSVVSLPDQSGYPPPGGAVEPPAGSGAHRAPDAQADPGAPYYGQPSTPQYGEPPSTASWDAAYAPPAGAPTGPAGGGPNKKLIIGILAGAAAIILILAVVLTYVFVIRDDDTTVTASSSSSSSSSAKTTSKKTSTTASETSESAAPTRTAGPVTDGNLTFTITDIEAAESVTSTFSDAVGKTAQGTYAVVHLTVGNVGPDPVTFLATFQRLNGSGQSLAPDDEATVFAGGGYADVAPGTEVETIVVFDVPDDVEPESMFFQQDPVTPGVDLPF